jgi:Dolichyl-phosphate-mannose-protein mannosyltransferase
VTSRPGRLELGALLAILVLAAVTRLPGLDARGPWDDDQGTHMLAELHLVADGIVPLVGPGSSIGGLHHGAVYYYLLAPAAAISSADPVAVTTELALLGIAAVGAMWWLARRIGGPLAGVAAALLAAVSPSGIAASTFIWNPNLIPLAAAVAFAAALEAWQSARPRWWLVSAVAAMVTMQCHVLGVIAVPPLVALYLVDVRRRRAAGMDARPLLRAGVAAIAILAAGYLPLLLNELTTGFSETRGMLDYLGGGRGGSPAGGVVGWAAMIGMRSITWPFVGLITDRVAASMIGLAVVSGLAVLAAVTGPARDRRAASWLLATIAWSVLALTLLAPSLAVVTPGLPNDHYHAFLDPLLIALAGVGLARLAELGVSAGGGAARGWPGRLAAHGLGPMAPLSGALLALLVGVAVVAWPPAVSPDGGWALVDRASARVIGLVHGRPFALDAIPAFKTADALRFPLERRGAVPLATDDPAATPPPAAVVVVCDPLFSDVVGAACGGAAESAWLAADGRDLVLADRFEAGSRRVISVYLATAPAASR